MSELSIPIPLVDLRTQYAPLRDACRAAFDRVADSQHFILGPEVEALETELAAYCRARHAIGVSSGTDALLVALMALDVGPGDEVIVPALTFFATAGAVARLGATPVFVDVEPSTYLTTAEHVAAAITPRTKAVIPVHLYGQMMEMDPLLALAARHGLAVIEDACQAIGAEDKGRRAGSLGELSCFSFYPSKNLGGFGDAGLVTTNDDALAERVRRLRTHGGRTKYVHDEVGGNFRIDALQAAMLRVKLPHLDAWNAARRAAAGRYRELFANAGLAAASDMLLVEASPTASTAGGLQQSDAKASQVVLPAERPDALHIYHQFVIRTDRREAVIEELRRQQIGFEIYYPVPLHLQPCFAQLGYREGQLPASEAAARETLALPMDAEITEEQQARVVAAVGAGLSAEREA